MNCVDCGVGSSQIPLNKEQAERSRLMPTLSWCTYSLVSRSKDSVASTPASSAAFLLICSTHSLMTAAMAARAVMAGLSVMG